MVISMEENKTLPIYVPIILDDKEQKRRENKINTALEKKKNEIIKLEVKLQKLHDERKFLIDCQKDEKYNHYNFMYNFMKESYYAIYVTNIIPDILKGLWVRSTYNRYKMKYDDLYGLIYEIILFQDYLNNFEHKYPDIIRIHKIILDNYIKIAEIRLNIKKEQNEMKNYLIRYNKLINKLYIPQITSTYTNDNIRNLEQELKKSCKNTLKEFELIKSFFSNNIENKKKLWKLPYLGVEIEKLDKKSKDLREDIVMCKNILVN